MNYITNPNRLLPASTSGFINHHLVDEPLPPISDEILEDWHAADTKAWNQDFIDEMKAWEQECLEARDEHYAEVSYGEEPF